MGFPRHFLPLCSGKAGLKSKSLSYTSINVFQDLLYAASYRVRIQNIAVQRFMLFGGNKSKNWKFAYKLPQKYHENLQRFQKSHTYNFILPPKDTKVLSDWSNVSGKLIAQYCFSGPSTWRNMLHIKATLLLKSLQPKTYLLIWLFYFFFKNVTVFGFLLWDRFKPGTLKDDTQRVIFGFVEIID